MGNIEGRYDPQAEPSRDFTPIPVGSYRMKIIDSIIEPISKRNDKGDCVKLTWQVETGPYDGRYVWQRLNMWPQNMGENTDVVAQIANSQFASVRIATGKPNVKDLSELHHIPCVVEVGLSKPHPDFNQQNEVKSVKAVAAVERAARSAPNQRQAPGRPAAPAAGQSAPWNKPLDTKRDLDDEIPF